jgi:hypothetical protein
MRKKNEILKELKWRYKVERMAQKDVETFVANVLDEVGVAVDEAVDTFGKVGGMGTFHYVDEGYDALCKLSSDLLGDPIEE